MANMQNKKMQLNVNCNKEINIDKNAIKQLIIILLDNALKYTEENDNIEIDIHNRDDKLFINVKDTGIGISDEGLKHIFERFYREDKARSREKGGTGLGLSIAHTIVKKHGGSIKLIHNKPKGTIAIIKIAPETLRCSKLTSTTSLHIGYNLPQLFYLFSGKLSSPQQRSKQFVDRTVINFVNQLFCLRFLHLLFQNNGMTHKIRFGTLYRPLFNTPFNQCICGVHIPPDFLFQNIRYVFCRGIPLPPKHTHYLQFRIKKFYIHFVLLPYKTVVVYVYLHSTTFREGCQHYRSSFNKMFLTKSRKRATSIR